MSVKETVSEILKGGNNEQLKDSGVQQIKSIPNKLFRYYNQ